MLFKTLHINLWNTFKAVIGKKSIASNTSTNEKRAMS